MKKIYIIAVFVALLTGVAVYLYATHLEQRATVVVNTGTVVVSAFPIEENTKITSDMVTLRTTAVEWITPDAATRIEDVVGKMSRYRIPAGQQIVTSSVAEGDTSVGGKLSYVVKPGMRAVTFASDELSGVGFYLNKNDHVDIMATTVATKEDEQTAAIIEIPAVEMLLENVLILEVASRPQTETQTEENYNYTYASITVELSPEDAMKLYLATKTQTIYLLLRGAEDQDKVSPPVYVHPVYEYKDVA